ncbi:MAG: hypothetical protein NTU62_05240 [Spirochaetes bacterium]|nr:hypothetical protein [Spirochaetota bacterium]
MEQRARSAIASGAILIVIGVLLLMARLVPGFFGQLTWPFIVIGVGVLLLVLAIATGNAGLAVPACIVGGIGLILWWQNANNRWDTWSFAWTLIPGFVGVGALVQGLLESKPLKALIDALWPILISAVLFVVFSSFFGGPLYGVPLYYLAGGALILLGVLVILKGFLKVPAKTGTDEKRQE